MVSGLVAFLRARLDEDEATVSYAGPACIAWLHLNVGDDGMFYTTVAADNGGDLEHWVADGKDIPEPASVRVVYDPAKERRDIAAKRAIMARYERAIGGELPEWKAGRELIEAGAAILLGVLRDFAAVYSDHPDYHPEWRPAE